MDASLKLNERLQIASSNCYLTVGSYVQGLARSDVDLFVAMAESEPAIWIHGMRPAWRPRDGYCVVCME